MGKYEVNEIQMLVKQSKYKPRYIAERLELTEPQFRWLLRNPTSSTMTNEKIAVIAELLGMSQLDVLKACRGIHK
nr:MAG TPA: HTH-type transcriptional regulator [Caudoviricetes sp.]